MSEKPTVSDPTAVQRLHELNDEIPRLEEKAKQLAKDRAAAAKKVKRFARRDRYLRFAQWFRKPTARFAPWPKVAMIAGPLVAGIVLMILVDAVFGGFVARVLGFLLGVSVAAGVISALLHRPPNRLLVPGIKETVAKLSVANDRLGDFVGAVTAVNERLHLLTKERRELIATDKLQRAMLLQRKWKEMDEDEWKDYIVEVLRTLGAKVERQGSLGEYGIDMIITLHGRRIAVQAHGKGTPVNSSAVNEALAAKTTCGLDACAVVVNRRFSATALEEGERLGCTMVSVNKFPDFVLGKVEL